MPTIKEFEPLEPAIPETYDLPMWINPAAVGSPEVLDAIHAEARALEAELLALVEPIRDVKRRVVVLVNAVCNLGVQELPYDLPLDVTRAVSDVIGATRVDELRHWLIGYAGEELSASDDRDLLDARWGPLVEWTPEMSKACDELAGIPEPDSPL